ncbi:RDS2 [Candida pseudojiufengensis]|uniref:RDS2 n=1 Tax=Candida pseudojiufengensis TaxID=497109 RepID=UPI00222439BB|nr:RDS2 [Candida pseudojiufengensis]KAI5962491.1 RDS2 [Candida pseudojiufengensis]
MDTTKRKRKKKLEIACVYCRRSHMICDESRPCQRCIKRGISHLCYDEPSNSRQRKKAASLRKDVEEKTEEQPPQQPPQPLPTVPPQQVPPPQHRPTKSVLSQTLAYNQEPLFYSEHAGSEFSSLNDFLSMIDDPELVNGALNNEESQMFWAPAFSPNNIFSQTFEEVPQPVEEQPNPQPQPQPQQPPPPEEQPVISDSARDKFFLTAADPTTEISPEERLKQVIKAKLEAGLLQPYNYAKGYARLQRYMDNYMNISSRQRILKPLSIFRPAFRAIARTLKDVDLVLVEESFERMLLDYDRVFTSMAIPACLWRRTGEIYRGNKEFASLVGVTTDDLKDGKLAIYELMSEESAVNFWEKYGAIAFDKGQKAVLTSCNLRTKDGIKRKSCCFSFTIRRDRYNIPSCIVGNFIPIDP